MPFKINQPDKRGSEGPCSTLSQKNLNIGNKPVSVTVRADSMLSDFNLLTENRHLSLFSVLLLQTGPAFFYVDNHIIFGTVCEPKGGSSRHTHLNHLIIQKHRSSEHLDHNIVDKVV